MSLENKIAQIPYLEELIKKNPEVTARIDRYGDVSLDMELLLTEEDKARGWTKKVQRIHILYDFEPPEYNSLILSLEIGTYSDSSNRTVASTQLRYRYSNDSQRYSDLESNFKADEMEELIALGFKTENVMQLLKIGREKLLAALEHTQRNRIWNIVNVDQSIQLPTQETASGDPHEEDKEKLSNAGFQEAMIDKLVVQKSFSPSDQAIATLNWIESVQNQEVRIDLTPHTQT